MDENKTPKYYLNKKNILLTILLTVSFLFLLSYYFILKPYGNGDKIVHIKRGQSISLVAKEFEDSNIVRDDYILKFFIKILNRNKGIIPGDYLIKGNSPVFVVAWQISHGIHKVETIKITIREGLTNKKIADLLESKLINFDKDLFLNSISEKQGYLFPDTYFFFPGDTALEIIEILSNNFNNKIKDLPIKNSGKNLSEIITMASILEGEAKGKEDIYIISGILWKRISIGMPLQVDVDKLTYEVKGLPPNPINNPGLLSIRSALLPISSSYLYYIHDKEGLVHYAENFEEHKKNIEIYLK